MSPAKIRVTTQYVILALTILLFLAAGFVLSKVQEVRDNQVDTVMALRAGCERNNTGREVNYFLLTERISDAKIVGSDAASPAIRRRFVGQLTRTIAKREAFVANTGPHARIDKPWLVDCEAAYPTP